MGIFSRRKSKHALSDILKGLQCAINSVCEMAQAQQVQNLKKFWNESDGSPLCRKVKIGNKEIQVPLAILVSHNYLEMEDMVVNFKTRVSDIESKSLTNLLNYREESHSDLKVEMENVKLDDDNVLDITIRFKPKGNPEGIINLMDQYNKNI